MNKIFLSGILALSFFVSVPAVFAQSGDVDPLGTQGNICTNLSYDLRLASKDSLTNGQVSDLQLFLQSKGYLNSDPTGYFGLLTQGAVIKYQNAKSILPAYGFVGSITRGKINSESCGNNSNSINSNINQSTNQVSITNQSTSPVFKGISLNKNTFKQGEKVTVTLDRSGNFKAENLYFVYLKNRSEQVLGNNNPSRPITYSAIEFRKTGLGYPTFTFTIPRDTSNEKGGSSFNPGTYYLEVDYTDSNANVITSITSDSFKVTKSNRIIKNENEVNSSNDSNNAEKKAQEISINANYSVVGSNDEYKNFKLNLSGSSYSNPVKWWKLNFSCPSNISEVNAKVAGNICGGEDYQLGDVGGAGDIFLPFSVLSTDENNAILNIRIRAIGNDGNVMDDTNYAINVNKG